MVIQTEFNRSQLADLARGRLAHENYQRQQQLFKQQLKQLGADTYDLHLPETQTLPLLIQPGEVIEGIIYGRYVYKTEVEETISRGALAITSKRILLVNKKWFYVSCEEIGLDRVSGIMYTRVGPIGHVILHTRQGGFNMRTFNQQCARLFTEAVEAKLYKQERRSYDHAYYQRLL